VLGAFNIQPDQPTLVIPQQEKSREKRKRIILTVLALAVVVIVLLLFNRFWEPRSGGSEELIKNPISNSPTQGKIENQPSGNSEKTSGGEAQLQNDSDLTERQKTDSALNTNAVPQNNLPTKYGALVVDCNPWANIIIDGEQIQTTPLSRPISLPEGEYMLKLENPDYPIYSERIRIEGGETKRVRVSLASLLGYIAVKVYPWGDVYVNGDKKGQWPSKDIIKVVPGFVRVQVKNPYYDDIDTTFLISRGDTVSLRLSFKK
jgi:serine/threonine-protein kinase